MNKLIHICCVCGRWWAEHTDNSGATVSVIPWHHPDEARVRGLEAVRYVRTHTYCPPCKRAALEEVERTCADSE